MDSSPQHLGIQIPNVTPLQSYLQSMVVRVTVTYPDVKINRLKIMFVFFPVSHSLLLGPMINRDTRYTVTLATLYVTAVQALAAIGGHYTTL